MHAPFVPAGHNLSPHLGGNFWFLPCLFKIKTTFRLQPRLAVKCFVFISQCTASKGLSYKCFPSPAMSLLSQGYGGGRRDRAVHALFPLKRHLNNHGEGKQWHSANSCTCDVFIFCSETCMARTADSGACGSPLRHWHLKLSVWEQGSNARRSLSSRSGAASAKFWQADWPHSVHLLPPVSDQLPVSAPLGHTSLW